MQVLEAVKAHSPQTPTVLGGVHGSLLPRQSLSEPLLDFVIIGEGEVTLVELVRAIEARRTEFADIAGLALEGAARRGRRQRPAGLHGPLAGGPADHARLAASLQALPRRQDAGCPRLPVPLRVLLQHRLQPGKYRAKPLEVVEAEVKAITDLSPHVNAHLHARR